MPGAILTPCFPKIDVDWIKMRLSLGMPLGTNGYNIFADDPIMNVGEKRNQLAETALGVNSDWLFWIDDDIYLPPTALLDLYFQMFREDLDIVSGIYWSRSTEYAAPMMFDLGQAGPILSFPENELIEVGSVGFGCILIRRRVFEAMEPPYFVPLPAHEDIQFCKKAREAGFKIHVYTKVQCLHRDRNTGMFFPKLEEDENGKLVVAKDQTRSKDEAKPTYYQGISEESAAEAFQESLTQDESITNDCSQGEPRVVE